MNPASSKTPSEDPATGGEDPATGGEDAADSGGPDVEAEELSDDDIQTSNVERSRLRSTYDGDKGEARDLSIHDD